MGELQWRRPRLVAAAGIGGYALAWFLVGLLPLPGTDLDQFFRPAAESMLRSPLSPYSVAGQSAYPNANGPLALVPLAVLLGLERAAGIGWSSHLARALVLAAFSLVLLLMAREGVRAVERCRSPLSGRAKLAVYAVLALGPTTWQGDGGYGHVEQPIETWLVLLSARWLEERRFARSGALLGLAVLARTPAALFAVPLALAAGRRRLRDALLFLVSAGAVAVAGILPFLLTDAGDVVHSLVTYRGRLLVGVGSIWTLTRGTPLEGFAQHWDFVFIIAVVAAASAWLATRPGGLGGPRLYAALGLAAGAFALLAKTVWPYYFVEVYVFVSTWAMARRAPAGRALPWAAVAVIVLVALMAEVGATEGVPGTVNRLEGLVSFLLLLLAGFGVLRLSAATGEGVGRREAG